MLSERKACRRLRLSIKIKGSPDIELFAANFIAQLRSINSRKPAEDASPRDKRLETNARRREPWWPHLGLSQSKGRVGALGNEKLARMANSAGSYIGPTKATV